VGWKSRQGFLNKFMITIGTEGIEAAVGVSNIIYKVILITVIY